MEDKKFMTYEQQILFLRDEKKLIIKDEKKAMNLLKQHSYFALINGYKHPFKRKHGLYKSNTTIEDIYHLYKFDNQIRYILIRNIMNVEIHIKSLLSYAFSDKYGEEENTYLLATNYNYGDKKYQSDINELIQTLTKTQVDYKKYPYMKHQKEQHGNIPLWVMVKALTLGNLSKMYYCQKPDIQTKISKEFKGVTEGDLASFLDLITRFRNVCAHNERLFDHKYYKRCINDMSVHQILNIPKKKNLYEKGKSDLFALLISLKYLLDKEKFDVLIDEIDMAIDNLTTSTAQIQRRQLYKYMGFTDNWVELKNISV